MTKEFLKKINLKTLVSLRKKLNILKLLLKKEVFLKSLENIFLNTTKNDIV